MLLSITDTSPVLGHYSNNPLNMASTTTNTSLNDNSVYTNSIDGIDTTIYSITP